MLIKNDLAFSKTSSIRTCQRSVPSRNNGNRSGRAYFGQNALPLTRCSDSISAYFSSVALGLSGPLRSAQTFAHQRSTPFDGAQLASQFTGFTLYIVYKIGVTLRGLYIVNSLNVAEKWSSLSRNPFPQRALGPKCLPR